MGSCPSVQPGNNRKQMAMGYLSAEPSEQRYLERSNKRDTGAGAMYKISNQLQKTRNKLAKDTRYKPKFLAEQKVE